MKRSKPIQEFLDNFTKKNFDTTQAKAEKAKICVFCKKEITGFKDAISIREYEISGLCQECQDSVFG